MIRIAGFATWRFINFFKYLLKPRYVFFSFRFMLFKRFFELFRPRGLTRCHSATPILQLDSRAKPARPFGNLPGRVAAATNELGIRPLGLASEGPGIKRHLALSSRGPVHHCVKLWSKQGTGGRG